MARLRQQTSLKLVHTRLAGTRQAVYVSPFAHDVAGDARDNAQSNVFTASWRGAVTATGPSQQLEGPLGLASTMYCFVCLFVVGASALLPPVAMHPRAAKALPAKWSDSGPEKSATCVSKANQKPLTEYYSQREAEDAAEYAAIEYGTELEPYQCGRCQRWHLSPVERSDVRSQRFACNCKGADGRPKRLYSRRDAEQNAKLGGSSGVSLTTYACPQNPGFWHLTRSGAAPAARSDGFRASEPPTNAKEKAKGRLVARRLEPLEPDD